MVCCVAVYCGVVCSVMCSGAVVQWYSGAVVLRCAVRCMHMRLMGDEAWHGAAWRDGVGGDR